MTKPSSPNSSPCSSSSNPLRDALEIVPDRLYYLSCNRFPSSSKKHGSIHYFSIDKDLIYFNFFLDFGPLNLGQLYRFCGILQHKLRQHDVVCFTSSTHPNKQANAIFLICAYMVLYENQTPEEAFKVFCDWTLIPFHDASPCVCTFELTVLDCLRGLAKAMHYGFFDFDEFDVEEYEHFEQVENGDLNWIVKDRILAFAGPNYHKHISPEGYCTLAPSDYIPYFQSKNVALVVRLNKKSYRERDFIDAGIAHLEQFYLDGSCPPMPILEKVLEAFEEVPSDKAFAVHCKAGLGRTGTCIGAYLMKHYRFTAAEAIAWMRICRPGSVIGPQQHFLQDIEQRMWQQGSAMNNADHLMIPSPPSPKKKHESLSEHHGKKCNDNGVTNLLQHLTSPCLQIEDSPSSSSSTSSSSPSDSTASTPHMREKIEPVTPLWTDARMEGESPTVVTPTSVVEDDDTVKHHSFMGVGQADQLRSQKKNNKDSKVVTPRTKEPVTFTS